MSDGLASRRVAARALTLTLKQQRTLEAALERQEEFSALPPEDRAFARAISAATLRRLGQTEAILNAFLSKPLAETSEGARTLLLTGAAQLLWLGVPAHAVVSSAVNLAAERNDARKLKGLINAVLRKVATEGRTRIAQTSPRDNLPDWMRRSWRKSFGPAGLGRICEALTHPPALDLTLKEGEDAARWAETLDARILPNGSLRRETVRDVTALPGYGDGVWWAQDAAASLPARLLDAQPGETVVDLCAAPGGKTMQLAASGARVTAIDNSEHRLERLRENLVRTGLDARVLATDGRGWTPKRPVDAVLLDAPCTATGTLRRHPEAAWIKRETDVDKMAELQMALTKAAGKMLKPGGRLILCTCSLQYEEGEGLAKAVQRKLPELKAAPFEKSEVPGVEDALNPDGFVRTTPAFWPDYGGMDGFFIARFRRSD